MRTNGDPTPEEVETVASDLQAHRQDQAARDVSYRAQFDALCVSVSRIERKVDTLADLVATWREEARRERAVAP